jgi:hypothetical protein
MIPNPEDISYLIKPACTLTDEALLVSLCVPVEY